MQGKKKGTPSEKPETRGGKIECSYPKFTDGIAPGSASLCQPRRTEGAKMGIVLRNIWVEGIKREKPLGRKKKRKECAFRAGRLGGDERAKHETVTGGTP